MKDEIKRIMDLVKEGKLSPDDAAELIDAFMGAESGDNPTPPPPPPTEGFDEAQGVEEPSSTGPKDPFRTFVDFVESFGKDVSQSVNWQDVTKHVKAAAERGVEGVKTGVEQIRQGKVNFGWFSAQETKEVSLPLSVPEGKLLRIENPCGSVKVSGGFSLGTVAAKAQIRGATAEEAQLKAQSYTIIIEESEHSVLIRQPDVSGISVDLIVQLSSPCQVETVTQSGETRILDTKAGCRTRSQSGDVHLRGLNGPIEVTAQNGDVHLEECTSPSIAIESKHGDVSLVEVSGNVNARTAGGDIRGRDCSGKSYSLESVSGDISVEFKEAVSGTVNVRTVNGDSEVHLPDGSRCRVSLSTLRGSVTSGIPLEEEARQDQRITGRLGDGTGNLDVSAVNGSIALRWRNSAVPT